MSDLLAVARSATADARRGWAGLTVCVAALKLAEAWVLLPGSALLLAGVMARGGRAAVSDWDILAFLFTPAGAAYVVLLGVLTAGLLLVEQAAVLCVAHRHVPGPVAAERVVRLGGHMLARLVLAGLPFAALLGGVFWWFLSEQDINYYLAVKPPAFWKAVAVGGTVAAVAVAVGAWLLTGWALALPILLFERAPVRQALRTSRERVRGVFWAVGGLLAGWHLGIVLVAAVLEAGFRLLATHLPDGASESPRVLAAVLTGRGFALAGVSAVGAVGHALLTRRLYLWRTPAQAPQPTSERRSRVPLVLAVGVLVVVPLLGWLGVSKAVDDSARPVQITAHRGYASAAPENTRSALTAAADAGADSAEIDVQLTADGRVILLHDRDLKRVTGDPRRPDELTLNEVQKLDAGRWFDARFAGERVPTLEEAIAVCRGRLTLNIELKLYGPGERLAAAVAAVLAAERFEDQCVVTSFDLRALAELRRLDPLARTGPIVAAALGDVTRLDGHLVSVRSDLLTDRLLAHARKHGREVHVWTVNDERQMVRLLAKGVDAILTDEPGRLARVRADWAARTDAERLALAARGLLGLE